LKRRIAVVTGTRAEYCPLVFVLRGIREAPDLELLLVVTGAHLEPAFGRTVDEIRADGFSVGAEVPIPLASSAPAQSLARAVSAGVAGMGEALARLAPDLVMLVADRYETFAAAVAAVALQLPLAHVSGGESTEGLIDDQFRHAISKMSHLHFTSMEPYRRRLIRMGERPDRVFVVGEPGLEHCRLSALASREELHRELRLEPERPLAVVGFHPVTLELERTREYADALLSALDAFPELQLLLTYPGADPGSDVVIAAFEAYAARSSRTALFRHLGSRLYLSALTHASVLVGNSSSGISEAASFALPVVNVGSRQDGRLRARNVIDVACTRPEIETGLRRALAADFREALRGMNNPYGDGHTAARIVEVLSKVDLASLRHKRFYDGEPEGGTPSPIQALRSPS
jgi:UDP-hydrolysing UDP-N-acetyl-D-glucosamine 2-epimerase